MKTARATSGLLLLLMLTALGVLLVYMPGWLVEQYRLVREAGSTWVIVYFTVVGLGALILLTLTIWIVGRLWLTTRAKRERQQRRARNPSELTADAKAAEIDENLAAVANYEDEAASAELRRELAPLIQQLEAKRQAQSLEVVAFGTVSSGKSSLLNALAGREIFQTDPRGGTTLRRNDIPWPGIDRVLLIDTPGLGEVHGAEHAEVSADSAENADLVLFVVDGPLRDTEFQLLRRLADMEKRLLLCLNKEDWYEEDERKRLLGQLSQQTKGLIQPADVIAVRSLPTRRPRVRQLPDGRQVDEMVDVAPDISPLAERMLAVVQQDGRDLLLANLLLQSRGLVETARQRVAAALDARAWELVDRYMWGAGGAAALSPLPLLDLAAGGAVTIKMVVELAKVYRQDVDFDVAVNLLGQLGKNLLGILGVGAATPAVTSAVASLLKTVPGAGTLAGGVLQGLVQALITRWIGSVFIQYFKHEMQQPEGGLVGLARRQWQHMTTAAELKKLLLAAKDKL
jgi:uncharacterized protein (DUF697 family)/GTP-binding protein EngB required for normal cell division